MKKLIALLLASVTGAATILGGCSSGDKTAETTGALPAQIDVLGNTVSDIDDLPDWTGKQLNLVYWYCPGTNAPEIGKKAKNDVVRDELTRVSGISWDADASFDNNGETPDSKISKIIATDTWPDVAYSMDSNLLEKLADADKIYDLSEAIPKYMPNYMKIVNANEDTKKEFEDLKTDGKMWRFTGVSSAAAKYIDPDYSDEKYASLLTPEETRDWIWVRDDILKMLYPNAKTQSEIKEKYVQEGSYTEEDFRDVVISSRDEFKELLVNINNLGLTENGRKVWPFYTHDGSDNWGCLARFTSLMGAGCQSSVNYFAYYDNEQKKLVRTADQEWFKDFMHFYVELINEGLASKEALIDNKASFDQKKSNGEYAVIYGNTAPPTDQVLQAAGKTYSYRKVLLDIPMDHSRFIKPDTTPQVFDGTKLTIFKSNNIKTEEDLEQVLRYIDFFYSEAGMKFSFWGPKKAGLFTEENGVLQYTDKKLEEDRVRSGSNDMNVYYGFTSWPSLFFLELTGTPYYPVVVYDAVSERDASQYTRAWRYSTVEAAPSYPKLKEDWSIWNWGDKVPKVKSFWDARQASEDAFRLIFTATSDAEFEKYYGEMLELLDRNGLNEETMEEWNKAFEEVNKDYIDDFKNWKPEK